jgi:hypothetical protein
MTLKPAKKKSVASKKAKGPSGSGPPPISSTDGVDFGSDEETTVANIDYTPNPEIDRDDPVLTIPLARYNAMLAVLRNTLYMCVTFAKAYNRRQPMALLMNVTEIDMEVYTSEARGNIHWMTSTPFNWTSWIDIRA